MNYISLAELKAQGAIYVEDLHLGRNQFAFHVLAGSKEEYSMFFQRLIEQNGEENSYGDFYYKRVEDHGKEVLFSNSTIGEVRVMNEMFFDAHDRKDREEFVLVQLEERVLKTLLSISYNELLFSSFYFISLGCTIWSNYNGRFLVFAKDESVSNTVEKVATECGLQFES